jgi:hypothetical protein
MQVITRCRCGLPSLCGICISFALVLAPLVTIAVLIWRSGR